MKQEPKTLAAIITDAKSSFAPLPEELLRDRSDPNKIHPFWKDCSIPVRVYLGIILKVRANLVGTSALIPNEWLEHFAVTNRVALFRAVRTLKKHKLISVKKKKQRDVPLYRLRRPRTGKIFTTDSETDVEAIARLSDPTDRGKRRDGFAKKKWVRRVRSTDENED